MSNPLIGQPHKVTTVDRFQGQQNDYIILSLVRTKAVGHLRDVRRLVVAMSRARLGLYIFARVGLFQNCFELTPAFNQVSIVYLESHVPGVFLFKIQESNRIHGLAIAIIKMGIEFILAELSRCACAIGTV